MDAVQLTALLTAQPSFRNGDARRVGEFDHETPGGCLGLQKVKLVLGRQSSVLAMGTQGQKQDERKQGEPEQEAGHGGFPPGQEGRIIWEAKGMADAACCFPFNFTQFGAYFQKALETLLFSGLISSN
jgi:hypothetical protein